MKKFQKVSFAREIGKIMHGLHHANARLVVRFDKGDETFRSKVVSIDEETSTLGLSNFLTKDGHTEMPPRQELTIATVVGGMECLFATSLVYRGVTHAAHEVAFPRSLQYLQQRKSYRVDTAGTGLQVHCQMTNDGELSGNVIDLSATGLRFTVDKPDADNLDIGCVVKKCQLDLKVLGPVTFVATVRFKAEKNSNLAIIGIEIDDIENSDQVRIERFVSLRDLELRRQRSETRD